MTGIRAYLDELMAGEPNQPLRLLPLYLGWLRRAAFRRHGRATCSSLICPVRPPK